MKTARKKMMVLMVVMASVLAVSSVSTAAVIFSTSGGSDPTTDGFVSHNMTGTATYEIPGDTTSPPTWNAEAEVYGATAYYSLALGSSLDLTRDWTLNIRSKANNIGAPTASDELFFSLSGVWGERVDCNFLVDGNIVMYTGSWNVIGTHGGGSSIPRFSMITRRRR